MADTLKTEVRALVVGGGAVGTGIAYHLQKAGWDTMLLERDELIGNLVGALAECTEVVQQQMIEHLTHCDADYGRRVTEGLKQHPASVQDGKDEAVQEANREALEAQSY